MKKKIYPILILCSLALSTESFCNKSPIMGSILSLVPPIGGIGYLYAGEWDKYGIKGLVIETSLFGGAIAGTIFFGNGSSIGPNDGPGFYLTIASFLGWVVFEIIEEQSVMKLIENQNTENLSVIFNPTKNYYGVSIDF